jgi:hypothetical protein
MFISPSCVIPVKNDVCHSLILVISGDSSNMRQSSLFRPREARAGIQPSVKECSGLLPRHTPAGVTFFRLSEGFTS